MTNGFREQPVGSKGEQIRRLQTELQNTQMAAQMSQMMIKQLLENQNNLGNDLRNLTNMVMELQYKILAMQNVAGLDIAALNKESENLRLADFNSASEKEDKEQNLVIGDKVEKDSIVILTSTAPDGKGFFRSRIKLADCGVPELINGLQDQPVGTKVDVTLNGVLHNVELLGISNPAPVAEQPAAQ